MVEFCTQCGTSLPKGDLTFRKGALFTSPDYTCPHCGKPANPNVPGDHVHPAPEPTPDKDVVFRKGEAKSEG